MMMKPPYSTKRRKPESSRSLSGSKPRSELQYKSGVRKIEASSKRVSDGSSTVSMLVRLRTSQASRAAALDRAPVSSPAALPT
jgi:hypothetical protein